MWRNSSRSIDLVSVSFLWTKKFNKDFYLWKKFGLFLFLTDKFLYPYVSFVSLSLLSLTMLLFKIFDCWFCIYWLAISTCVFATLAIIGTTLVCDGFGSRVSYIKNFNLFLFVPDYSAMRHAIPGLLLDILRVGKDFYVEKVISKELVNPYGLYNSSLLMGAPPHMAILPG